MGTSAEKQTAFQNWLSKGVVMLHLDARRAGVRVPDYLKNQEWLRLNVNHVKGRGDLVVNDWGVRETLRFNGAWFPVSVPWGAVFALSMPEQPEQPAIFAEDLPEEMVQAALARLQREGYSLEELELRRPQSLWAPHPTPVPPEKAEPSPESAPKNDPREIRRGHLRLVK